MRVALQLIKNHRKHHAHATHHVFGVRGILNPPPLWDYIIICLSSSQQFIIYWIGIHKRVYTLHTTVNTKHRRAYWRQSKGEQWNYSLPSLVSRYVNLWWVIRFVVSNLPIDMFSSSHFPIIYLCLCVCVQFILFSCLFKSDYFVSFSIIFAL